jgi:hypothetical protein
VPPACAALWAPYQVTKVPPPDILHQEHVPAAPPVINMTNGAVSDATAQQWANADLRVAGWFRWAEGFGQEVFLHHLGGSDTLNPAERTALDLGATIAQPDCNLYPSQRVLFAVGPDGDAYFLRRGLPADNNYVLVEAFTGPCSAIATYPNGQTQNIVELPATTLVFVPGTPRSDPILGDIWYSDAGGNCSDPAGPPPQWCGR